MKNPFMSFLIFLVSFVCLSRTISTSIRLLFDSGCWKHPKIVMVSSLVIPVTFLSLDCNCVLQWHLFAYLIWRRLIYKIGDLWMDTSPIFNALFFKEMRHFGYFRAFESTVCSVSFLEWEALVRETICKFAQVNQNSFFSYIFDKSL